MKKFNHYYSEKPDTKLDKQEIQVNLLGIDFKFNTAASTFSKTRIDAGTYVLISRAEITENSQILDLGCGYGAVGIAIAKKHSDCTVLMTDINERAVKLSQDNIKLNQIDNAKVRKSNIYDSIPEQFDNILLNPPQTAGKKICFQMIEEAKDHLNPEGKLQLVARHKKGGKELGKKMNETFGNLREIAKKSGYRIYISQKE